MIYTLFGPLRQYLIFYINSLTFGEEFKVNDFSRVTLFIELIVLTEAQEAFLLFIMKIYYIKKGSREKK